jgi:protein SCO1/2
MNTLTRLFAVTAAILAAVGLHAGAASAHPLEDLQQELVEDEKYFQIKNQPAPDFTLEDAEGNPVRLQDMHGKVVVLHFIYAGCPDVCPLHADRIAQVQEMVNSATMKDQVHFITITTDPVRDTPEVLRGYGEPRGLDPANWSFLTSGPERPEDTTRKLAEAFGHRFSVTADAAQIHGVVTHVIDRNGQWVANFHGLRFDPTSLVIFVNALVNDIAVHGEAQERSVWETIRSVFQQSTAETSN